MFSRSKKMFNIVNKKDIFACDSCNFNHSEFLRMLPYIKNNPLSKLGEKHFFYPLINFSEKLFINNSIGFCVMINENNEYSLVIPLNTKLAIAVIPEKMHPGNKNSFFIDCGEEGKVDTINKSIVYLEKIFGNGFFFGQDEVEIEEYVKFFNNIK